MTEPKNNSASYNGIESINSDLDVQENDLIEAGELHINFTNEHSIAILSPGNAETTREIGEEQLQFHEATEESNNVQERLIEHPLMDLIAPVTYNQPVENMQANINNDLDENEYENDDDDLELYLNVNENDDDNEDEGGYMFETDEDEGGIDFRVDETDEYESVQKPNDITYNTELPSSHNYLGRNFQDVQSSKNTLHESNDEIIIPLLALPGNSYYENETDNYVQLIPGQVMPIYFYSPLQTQIIRKRMNDMNPTIGFVFSSKALKVTHSNQNNVLSQSNLEQSSPQAEMIDEDKEDLKIGILAEIISASHQNDENEIGDFSSMVDSAGGVILKVKGRDRFRILNVSKDITGCFIGTVRILPEYVLDTNPLMTSAPRNNTSSLLESYLYKNGPLDALKCSRSKAEALNTLQPMPAWIYRKYDCSYLIHMIRKELVESFQQQIPFAELAKTTDNEMKNSAIVFCSWLLSNFPFDNKMRLNCLKMNCINERLSYMYNLLKNFTNICCRLCGVQFCSKSDVFSMTKQGFMDAYLNPGGVVHETLTIYKLKNFHMINGRPSTQHSWFPGKFYFIYVLICSSFYFH